MLFKLKINEILLDVEAEPETPLLWVLRDNLDLTGTKYDCGISSCGACTVHLNGTPVRSCSIPVESAIDSEITTIEGLRGKVANSVQQACREKDVVQCRYCQSGQIMSAVGLLKNNSSPNNEELDGAMSGNVCRCAIYSRIRDSIKLASQKLKA